MATSKVIREVFVDNTASTTTGPHQLSTTLYGGEIIVVHYAINDTTSTVDPIMSPSIDTDLYVWEEMGLPTYWNSNTYRHGFWLTNACPILFNDVGITWQFGAAVKSVFVYYIIYGHDNYDVFGSMLPQNAYHFDYTSGVDNTDTNPFLLGNTTRDAANDLFDMWSCFTISNSAGFEHTTDSGYNDKGESVVTTSDFCNHHWIWDEKATTTTALSGQIDAIGGTDTSPTAVFRLSFDEGLNADYDVITGDLFNLPVTMIDYVENPVAESHTTDLTLPADIPEGALILLVGHYNEETNVRSIPSGYTQVYTGRLISPYIAQVGIEARIADGTEGGTDVTFTCLGATRVTASAYVFGNVYDSATITDVVCGNGMNQIADETPLWEQQDIALFYGWTWDKHATLFSVLTDGQSGCRKTRLNTETTPNLIHSVNGLFTPLRNTGTAAEEEWGNNFIRTGWKQTGQMAFPDALYDVESLSSSSVGHVGAAVQIRAGTAAPVGLAFGGSVAGDGGVMWPPRANDPRWTQLLTDSGITQSGNFIDDVKAALIALSGASGGSLDDLWKKTLAANSVTDISEPYLY